jgi:hypothetical protein
MRKNSLFMTGMLALLLTFGLVLGGCPNGNDDDDDDDGANKVTILNSTDVSIVGIRIQDGDADADHGYLVGTEAATEVVDIAPGATYTSPEIKAEYVNLNVKTSDNNYADAYAQELGDFELVAVEGRYELKEK